MRLISYRRADCVDEMIEFTVRYHFNPCAHILSVSFIDIQESIDNNFTIPIMEG